LQEELTRLKEIENSIAVFCLATYGEGDPTDNAMDFFEWLMNGNADLSGLRFAVSYLNVLRRTHAADSRNPNWF
jgi:sulfite reductase alpha subunit-like flavoprotein